MTDNPSTPTDAQPDEKIQQLEERVAELESMTEIGDEDGDGWSMGDLLDLGLTRRQALTAVALLSAGYALGPAITKALSEPAAASHGGASLGTASNPLQEIYVHDLYNETDNIVADSVSTDAFNTDNEVEAFGADGDLFGYYSVSDYADLGAAVNQAIADGAARLLLPDVTQSYATTITADVSGLELVAPETATYTYTGSSRAVEIAEQYVGLYGGWWENENRDYTDGTSAIELRSDATRVNNCEVFPSVVIGFGNGIHLHATNNAVGYNQYGINFAFNNANTIHGEVDSNHINWNVGHSIRSSAPDVQSSATTANGWKFTVNGGSSPVSWPVQAAVLENLNNGVNGDVAGWNADGWYSENVDTDATGNNQEVYYDDLQGGHSFMAADAGSRTQTELAKLETDNGVHRYRAHYDGTDLFEALIDGQSRLKWQQDGTRVHNRSVNQTAVSTSATTIADSTYFAFHLVVGVDQSDSLVQFTDFVLSVGESGASVVESQERGTPSARSYTISTNDLQLSMGSGTYDVTPLTFRMA